MTKNTAPAPFALVNNRGSVVHEFYSRESAEYEARWHNANVSPELRPYVVVERGA